MPDPEPCPSCGGYLRAPTSGICDACRLAAGLNDAARIYLRFRSRHPTNFPSEKDFEILCQDHPHCAPDLRQLRDADLASPKDLPRVSMDSPPPPRRAEDASPGRYLIEEHLASGGMGIIYAVQDRELRRRLAMKMLVLGGATIDNAPPLESLPAATVDRFVEEAQITAQLDHPGIVPVHELGIDPQGRLFFTMKLVEGRNLSEVFEDLLSRRGEWTFQRVVGVLVRACQAVAYAHRRGVIHRDLKPHNIMVGSLGEVYVMDWGLARASGQPDLHDLRPDSLTRRRRPQTESRSESEIYSESPLVTADGTVLGTPVYMSPEHATGHVDRVDARSDVYSLGAILFQLLAGHPPYLEAAHRPSAKEVLTAVQQGPPNTDALRNSDHLPELVAACAKAMARNPQDRYGNAAEFANDLQAWLEHRVVQAHSTGLLAQLRSWIRRNRRFAVAATLGLLAVLAGLVGVASSEIRARQASLRRFYASSLSGAADRAQRGYQTVAHEILSQCPPNLRGWEWHYLTNQVRRWSKKDLFQEPEGLKAVVYSPHLDALLTAGRHQSIRVRKRTTSAELFRFGPTNLARLAIDSSGRRVAAAETSGRISWWDIATGQSLGEHLLPESPLALALSPDGSRVVVSWGQGHLGVFTVPGSDLQHSIQAPIPVGALAFRDAGRRVVLGDQAGHVREWCLDPPSIGLQDMGRQHGPVGTLVISPNDDQVVSGKTTGQHLNPALIVWNRSEGWNLELPSLSGFGEVTSLAFDAAGARLYTCSWFGSIQAFDLPSGRLEAALYDGSSDQHGLLMLPGERGLLRWNLHGFVEQLTLNPDHAVRLAGPIGQLRSIVVSEEDRLLRVAHRDGGILEWDLPSRSLVRTMSVGRTFVTCLDQSVDGKWLAAGGTDGFVRLLDGANGAILWSGYVLPTAWKASDIREPRRLATRILMDDDPVCAVLRRALGPISRASLETWERSGTPTGAEVNLLVDALNAALADSSLDDSSREARFKLRPATVELYQSTLTGPGTADRRRYLLEDVFPSELARVGTPDLWWLDISPNQRWLVTGSTDGTLRFLDVPNRKWATSPVQAHGAAVEGLRFSPDGIHFASCAADGSIALWRTADQTEIWRRSRPGARFRAIAFSPNGRSLAHGGGDGTAYVRNTADGTVRHALVGHGGRVLTVTYSPDGHRIATAAVDGRVSVWDAETGWLLVNLNLMSTTPVWDLVFSHQGRDLFAADGEGVVTVWSADIHPTDR
jgi:serine/threonine protein kinase/WD40 repeat protein